MTDPTRTTDLENSVTLAVRNNHEVALRPTSDDAIGRLVEWAQAADAAFQMATRLVNTRFVPAAYRGKEQEATAAILAGAEVGLSPMASLRAFDDIQGTPAPKAITLRAIVQGMGHDIRIDESTAERAVVVGRRKGTNEWQTSTWDINRAKRMGLTEKSEWKKQPAAMLVARATSEVCRWIAADAIMGMPYSAEEIRDGDGDPEVRPAPKRVTAAEILGVDEAPAPTADVQAGEPQPETVRRDQQRHMFALFGDLGYGGDDNRNQRLEIVGKILKQEPPASSNDLTADEADTVIEALKLRKAQREAAAQQGGGS